MASASLSPGDRVIYPNQGLCTVQGVTVQEVAGQKLSLLTLVREEDGARVMVPEGKVVTIGIRRVSSRDDAEKVFQFLRSDSDKTSLDWKMRAKTNGEKMATGGLLGLADVVKGLQVLSELRPLAPKERETYDNARSLLVDELAVALGVLPASAEDAVDVVLYAPGKERPKRTAEEFQRAGGADGDEVGDDLEALGDDGGFGDDVLAGIADEPAAEADAAPEPDEEAAAEDEAPKPRRGRPAKGEGKADKPARTAKKPAAKAEKKAKAPAKPRAAAKPKTEKPKAPRKAKGTA